MITKWSCSTTRHGSTNQVKKKSVDMLYIYVDTNIYDRLISVSAQPLQSLINNHQGRLKREAVAPVEFGKNTM